MDIVNQLLSPRSILLKQLRDDSESQAVALAGYHDYPIIMTGLNQHSVINHYFT